MENTVLISLERQEEEKGEEEDFFSDEGSVLTSDSEEGAAAAGAGAGRRPKTRPKKAKNFVTSWTGEAHTETEEPCKALTATIHATVYPSKTFGGEGTIRMANCLPAFEAGQNTLRVNTSVFTLPAPVSLKAKLPRPSAFLVSWTKEARAALGSVRRLSVLHSAWAKECGGYYVGDDRRGFARVVSVDPKDTGVLVTHDGVFDDCDGKVRVIPAPAPSLPALARALAHLGAVVTATPDTLSLEKGEGGKAFLGGPVYETLFGVKKKTSRSKGGGLVSDRMVNPAKPFRTAILHTPDSHGRSVEALCAGVAHTLSRHLGTFGHGMTSGGGGTGTITVDMARPYEAYGKLSQALGHITQRSTIRPGMLEAKDVREWPLGPEDTFTGKDLYRALEEGSHSLLGLKQVWRVYAERDGIVVMDPIVDKGGQAGELGVREVWVDSPTLQEVLGVKNHFFLSMDSPTRGDKPMCPLAPRAVQGVLTLSNHRVSFAVTPSFHSGGIVPRSISVPVSGIPFEDSDAVRLSFGDGIDPAALVGHSPVLALTYKSGLARRDARNRLKAKSRIRYVKETGTRG